MKPLLSCVATMMLALGGFAHASSGENRSTPVPKPLVLSFSVKSVTVAPNNYTSIELSLLDGGEGDGLLLTFIPEPGKECSIAQDASHSEIERFVRFDPLPGGNSSVPERIAKHFGVGEITLFSGSAWWAGLLLPPEKLEASGGNFWLHEGAYPTKGYDQPEIKLGFNGVFKKGSKDVTLTIWRR